MIRILGKSIPLHNLRQIDFLFVSKIHGTLSKDPENGD